MKLYESVDFLPSNSTYLDFKSGEYIPLKFLKLCKISKVEDMDPLDLATIKRHAFGVAAVGTLSTRGGEIKDVLSHAAVKDFGQHGGKTLAVIGGVITIPSARRIGLGSQTVSELMDVASTQQALTAYGHEGFKAVCNPIAEKLFLGLGFVSAGQEQGKPVFVKEI